MPVINFPVHGVYFLCVAELDLLVFFAIFCISTLKWYWSVVFFSVVSLFAFHMRVILASENDLGSVSSSIFGKNFWKITINYYLNVLNV